MTDWINFSSLEKLKLRGGRRPKIRIRLRLSATGVDQSKLLQGFYFIILSGRIEYIIALSCKMNCFCESWPWQLQQRQSLDQFSFFRRNTADNESISLSTFRSLCKKFQVFPTMKIKISLRIEDAKEQITTSAKSKFDLIGILGIPNLVTKLLTRELTTLGSGINRILARNKGQSSCSFF